MYTVIFSGGTITDTPAIQNEINKADKIICADSGADFLISKKVIPDILLGDFDSISTEIFDYIRESNKTEIIHYPTHKDNTDTQLAVLKAVEIGSTEISILGALGTRMDHGLSNIFLLEYIYDKGIKCKIVDANNYIFIIKKEISIKKLDGYKLSLLPITNDVSGITTKGLKYELRDGVLKRSLCIGVSNEFVNDIADIKIKEGILLVMLVKD